MTKVFARTALLVSGLAIVGCGSSSGAFTSSSSGGNAGSGGQGTTSGGSTTVGGGGNASAGASSAGTGGAIDLPCPMAAGYYGTIVVQGAGCGDLDSSSGACASVNGQSCSAKVQGDSDKSVNGTILLQADGSFTGAMISEGSAMRSGCTGNLANGVLTITCGGSDPTVNQYCSVKLTRTADSCP